jgi:hypothetical protein
MIRPTSLAGGRDQPGGHARYQFGKSRIEAQPNEPVRPLGSVLRNTGATNCPPRIPKNSFGSTKAVRWAAPLWDTQFGQTRDRVLGRRGNLEFPIRLEIPDAKEREPARRYLLLSR